jgi:CTP synthase
VIDHPFFLGFQAHPEFCTRPLNPSPPFLGFIAAASGQKVLSQQLEVQLTSFKPPHPEGVMVGEAELQKLGKPAKAIGIEVTVNGKN